MKGILSKISIIFFFLLSTFYLLPSIAHANTTPQANYPVVNTNPDVPNNLHNWTQNVMIEVMSALTCQLAGVDPINPKQGCLGIDSESGKIGFLPTPQTGGAIGFMGNMIATLYTPPLHTADYFKDLASNFGINKKAYAQSAGLPAEASAKAGTGFQGLTPLIGVWSAFRNIVYLFLVIIFVVIGLAIMLRVKIDPRTVMSIQNQIPKIIIGILVVTFSFAIAGFLVDLMWVVIYLIYNIIAPIAGIDKINQFNPSSLQTSNPFGLMGGSFLTIPFEASRGVGEFIGSLLGGGGLINGPAGFTIGTAAGAAVGGLLGSIVPGIGNLVGISIGAGLGALIANFATSGTGDTLGFVGGIIAFIVIIIALLFALFRLWFALIMAYVHILIDVVLAPFWIIGGIVPGSPISLSGWLRDLIANLAAFPAVIGLFLLGKVFMDTFGTSTKGQFVPPLIGNPGDTSAIGALIGLGVILMAPNVVNMLKTALKTPKVDTGLGKAIGAGTGITGIPGRLGQLGLTISGMQYVPGINRIPFIGKRTPLQASAAGGGGGAKP